MFDAALGKPIKRFLYQPGKYLVAYGVGANTITVFGLGLGVLAAILIALGHPLIALLPLLLSRLADALDGVVARIQGTTDFGGYFDITADFLFYGLIPLGFVWLDPEQNGVAGAFLLTSFYFNGATFLGYAILAEKHKLISTSHGRKSLYFTGGLLEAGETIIFFVILCLWPAGFPFLAWIFGVLCFITAFIRVLAARRELPSASCSSDDKKIS